jgi:hypothetical protein
MSVDCGALSLNQRVCVKPANHEPKTHRAADGREWEPNQNWQAEIGNWFTAQGIDASDDQIIAFRDTVMERGLCDHGRSWTGVDNTDIRAPFKTWRCDDCGHVQELPR